MEQAIESFLKQLASRGFAVLSTEVGERVLDELRKRAAIHLVQVYRLPRGYIVVEVNTAPCRMECDHNCRDVTTGKLLMECFVSCMDRCVSERISLIRDKLSYGGSTP